MIVSYTQFEWFLSLVLLCPALAWIVVDTIRLKRALPEGKAAHDRIFGSIIGLCVALAGLSGVILYHL